MISEEEARKIALAYLNAEPSAKLGLAKYKLVDKPIAKTKSLWIFDYYGYEVKTGEDLVILGKSLGVVVEKCTGDVERIWQSPNLMECVSVYYVASSCPLRMHQHRDP